MADTALFNPGSGHVSLTAEEHATLLAAAREGTRYKAALEFVRDARDDEETGARVTVGFLREQARASLAAGGG